MDELPQDMLPTETSEHETVYIVDRELSVVYVNAQWKQFAHRNNGQRVLDPAWNRRVLENFSGSEREKWRHIYRLLLEGRLPLYQEEFNASGPYDRRRFRLRITPRRDAAGVIQWLIHRTLPVERGPRRWPAINDAEPAPSPERISRQYRERILQRPVHFPAFRTARHLEPLDEVGGDILWSCERPDGCAFLMHADSVGHGVDAAAIASRIVGELDELALTHNKPSAICERINTSLIESTSNDNIAFATGLLFRSTRDPRYLEATNFGHFGPIFSRAGMVEIESGLPLGIEGHTTTWPTTIIDLRQCGNRFLVFSDGVLEQFAPNGEPYGINRLLGAFRANLRLPLDEMLQSILDDLTEYRGEAIVKDDQTVLALELIDQRATMAA